MRTLTVMLRRLWHRAGAAIAGFLAAASLMIGASGAAYAECPWIVQPHFGAGKSTSDTTLMSIVFDGLAKQQNFFYGFTVTNIDLAWDLSAYGTLTDLGPDGRALDVAETATGQTFAVSAESIEPHTVYLVAARSPVSELEKLEAAIEPSRPINVSYLKTRGASDISGPMPKRSLPGVEIRASDVAADVTKWLKLHDQGIATDGDRIPPNIETTLAVNEIDSSTSTQNNDSSRRDVQICAYQVAIR